MREGEIAQIALENLKEKAGIVGKWKSKGPKDLDGEITLKIDDHELIMNVEIKNELRGHQLDGIYGQADRYGPLIVIARHILPSVKEELRKKNIAYLEGNGSIFLKNDKSYIWLNFVTPFTHAGMGGNRAFTKTGLKVVFQFLVDESLINMPYREIARITDVALGNVNYIMTGLKELGFLVQLNCSNVKLTNKRALLEKWMSAYQERLKPSLKIDSFRFLNEETFRNWKGLPITQGKTWWGGEPAGDILTHYLNPHELTLYTTETRNDIMRNYRLVPDERGNVKVYHAFWVTGQEENVEERWLVPELLVYTDLINTGESRCIEVANKIFEMKLKDELGNA